MAPAVPAHAGRGEAQPGFRKGPKVIRIIHPAIDGEHCFYFAPEPGGLTRALDHAFSMQNQLPDLATAGRRLVEEHHTFPKLRDYVISETLEAHARSKD